MVCLLSNITIWNLGHKLKASDRRIDMELSELLVGDYETTVKRAIHNESKREFNLTCAFHTVH